MLWYNSAEQLFQFSLSPLSQRNSVTVLHLQSFWITMYSINAIESDICIMQHNATIFTFCLKLFFFAGKSWLIPFSCDSSPSLLDNKFFALINWHSSHCICICHKNTAGGNLPPGRLLKDQGHIFRIQTSSLWLKMVSYLCQHEELCVLKYYIFQLQGDI